MSKSMVQNEKRSCGTVAGLNYVDSIVLKENTSVRCVVSLQNVKMWTYKGFSSRNLLIFQLGLCLYYHGDVWKFDSPVQGWVMTEQAPLMSFMCRQSSIVPSSHQSFRQSRSFLKQRLPCLYRLVLKLCVSDILFFRHRRTLAGNIQCISNSYLLHLMGWCSAWETTHWERWMGLAPKQDCYTMEVFVLHLSWSFQYRGQLIYGNCKFFTAPWKETVFSWTSINIYSSVNSHDEPDMLF